jgi:hypothetical protein
MGAFEAMTTAVRSLDGRMGRIERLLRHEAYLRQAWFSVSECAREKGLSKSFLDHNAWAQPLGGNGRQIVGGRYKWTRKVVREWLRQTDDDLREKYEPKRGGLQLAAGRRRPGGEESA